MIAAAKPSTIMYEDLCPRGDLDPDYMIVLCTELALAG
jgi:hypothetical protein